MDNGILNRSVMPVLALFLAQVAFAVVAAVFLHFQGMQAAGCADACDYETAYSANVAFWITSACVSAATLLCLLVWHRRGWRNWTIPLASIAVTLAAVIIASVVVSRAL